MICLPSLTRAVTHVRRQMTHRNVSSARDRSVWQQRCGRLALVNSNQIGMVNAIFKILLGERCHGVSAKKGGKSTQNFPPRPHHSCALKNVKIECLNEIARWLAVVTVTFYGRHLHQVFEQIGTTKLHYQSQLHLTREASKNVETHMELLISEQSNL